MSEKIIGYLENLPCDFCQRTDDCPEKYGEKRTYEEFNLSVHYYCLLMSSGIWQKGEEEEGFYGFLIEDIQKEVNRAARLKCNICKKRGASIGCVASRCKRSYHFPCGIERKCIFQFRENFPSYCWKHRPIQKPPSDSTGCSQCTICLELVEHSPSHTILTTSCCKNAWFHRDCLQRQALSAGVFFLRCPVCNNKEKFQNEMLRMGIYIPEKDASWELEENAYHDLLQCYQHCDIRRCICKNGRDYSKPDSKWEIKRCQCCGSSGTHLACSSLTREQNWECMECRSILASSEGNCQKWRKRSLTVSEKTDIGDSLLEEPSPKCPRQSPGSHLGFLVRSPKKMCNSGLTPLDLPSSNRLMSPTSLISPSVRNLSLRKMQLGMQKNEACNLLRELRSQINTKPLTLNINKQNIWDSTIKCFRKRSFNPANTIEVNYINCEGKVEMNICHSPKEDFFQSLMLHLQNSSLFEGGSSKNLSFDSQALKDDLYYEAGRMIAVSLVHGGPSLSFFSKTLFNCLVYGIENVKPTVEDVADVDVLQAIMKIKSAKNANDLESAISDHNGYLRTIGCLKHITALCDKDMLVNEIVDYHVIKRTLAPFERFRQGLRTLGVWEKMQMNPDAFCSILCHKPEKLSAKLLSDLFTIHCLLSTHKARSLEFWMGYLQETEDGESAVTLEDILMFATGTGSIPAIGFEPEPTVKFTNVNYPVGNRHLNCLELPVTRSYEKFKRILDFTIRSIVRLETKSVQWMLKIE
ncbi:G2/M phase-specific E3 ubiquitin-protein ligase [Sphaerodactylus townsendi]|uniref:G2/M phase-specific E3 ubiquitin-protein ligase n=1 Tax=Sphaerodactylus townsendi TaxID=933632 RepID=UPI002026ACCD|nr:G2/M phase-specific E3 ubiquitin-protein ligase [Sphaerodactylus townsendi]XP_048341427.1 G2/M phase-specific E3 ubiquitin-protein ligase [Sphaerodactylus townsendi]XP_048341428.1 G2/M phase-specific E3 ubiquitin-protein ligase [Sphaerodactylus townsendi]